MSSKPVVIFGAGSFAEVAAAYLARDSPREVVAFTVDGQYVEADVFANRPLIPFEELVDSHPPNRVDLLVATGFRGVNEVRKLIYARCKALGYGFVSYVSSRAIMMSDNAIGENTFIFEANVVQPFVEIGDNVVLWSGNHVGHHSRIANHCFIASHAVISGHVTIGEGCFIGVNATLRDGISLQPRCVIGAGALVLGDQEEGTVLAAPPTPIYRKKSWELNNF
jgi:sugar O-acyltransferase (sialic acid O-acetyltransferase NeuD family)